MSNRIIKISGHLRKYLLVYIVSVIAIAALIGYNMRAYTILHRNTIKNTILVLAILTLLPSMIQLRPEKFGKEFMNKKIETLIALTIIFVVGPLTAIVLASYLPSKSISIGFVAANSVPASSASIAYVLLAEGNIEFATLLAMISIMASIVLSPVYIGLYASSISVGVPIDVLGESIILALLTPFIIGQVTRYYIIKRKAQRILKNTSIEHPCKNVKIVTHRIEDILTHVEEALECIEGRINARLKPYLSLWTMITMLLLIGTLITVKASLIIMKPFLVGEILGLQALVYITIITTLIIITRTLHLSYEDHSAIAFISLTKNESVAAAISVMAIGAAAAIPAALIPSIQPLIAVLYLWVLPALRKALKIELRT